MTLDRELNNADNSTYQVPRYSTVVTFGSKLLSVGSNVLSVASYFPEGIISVHKKGLVQTMVERIRPQQTPANPVGRPSQLASSVV